MGKPGRHNRSRVDKHDSVANVCLAIEGRTIRSGSGSWLAIASSQGRRKCDGESNTGLASDQTAGVAVRPGCRSGPCTGAGGLTDADTGFRLPAGNRIVAEAQGAKGSSNAPTIFLHPWANHRGQELLGAGCRVPGGLLANSGALGHPIRHFPQGWRTCAYLQQPSPRAPHRPASPRCCPLPANRR